MATVGTKNLTLQDYLSRTDPNGAMAYIVEDLSKMTPVIEDAVTREGNMVDGHKFTAREALPTTARRRLNRGVPTSKSKTAQVKEPSTTLVARSTIDVEELALAGGDPAFRASEDVGFLQKMTQDADEAILYDAKDTDADECTGLIPRLDSTTGDAGKQIVLWGAGNAGQNASMLLVGWGDQTVHTFFPKGSKGGLSHDDLGERLIDDGQGTGDTYRAMVAEWTWKLGVAVKDKRFLARVANIDMVALAAEANGDLVNPVNDLIKAAVKAYHKIYAPNAAKLRWYVPRDLGVYLHLQAMSSVSHSTLTIERVDGQPVTMLCGVPVRYSDSMTTSEDTVA